MTEQTPYTNGIKHRKLKDRSDIRNRFTLRVRDDELIAWKIAAAASKKTLSKWLRDAAKAAQHSNHLQVSRL